MLETLRIQNYALIDTLEVDFRNGLSVLTGETGAGKSIIVGALTLILGGRASSEAIRDGAAKATVDAVFRLGRLSKSLRRLLDEYEIEPENGDTLLVSRSVGADGRSRAFAAGKLVPVAVLAALGDELVDLHGQHEHQSLLKPDRQLALLDAFGGLETLAGTVTQDVAAYRAAQREAEELARDDRDRARRVDFLKFELDEIDHAQLQPGEEKEVKARRDLITNAEQIAQLASSIHAQLFEAEGAAAVDLLGGAAHDIEQLALLNPQFRPFVDQLESARTVVEEVASEIRKQTDDLDFDPEELETLNRRIAQIGELKRKYGASIDDILSYRNRIAAEIESFERRDERLAELRAQSAGLLAQANDRAQQLSNKRAAAARKLDKLVTAALQDLGMKGAKFEADIEAIELNSDGIDRVEYHLAANPGEKPKPLRQVASGGEISRIMLALKAVFAEADAIPTLIFDEIDAGVGGAVANKVAAKLRQLARSHQVICITHLPQIAAAAATHFNVSKAAAKGRTTTALREVVDGERAEEIARMLSGSVSDISLGHARELLKALSE